jgi:uncharacterized damage-inducible protein DinB
MMRAMNALHILLRQAENNLWANARLHAACAKLTRDEYEATRTSFFPTLRKTLEHIYLVDGYYLDALVGGGHGRQTYLAPDPTFDRFADLAVAQRDLDRKLVAFVAALGSDAALDEIVVVQRRVHDVRERVGDVLEHLLQHQIHHRGQAHAMLAGTNAAPPQLDEFFLAEDLPLRERELREAGVTVR